MQDGEFKNLTATNFKQIEKHIWPKKISLLPVAVWWKLETEGR